MPIRKAHRRYYRKAFRDYRLKLIAAAGGEICGQCGIELAQGINGAGKFPVGFSIDSHSSICSATIKAMNQPAAPAAHGPQCMCGGEMCGRRKPLREEIHEMLNREQVRIAERGLAGIDQLKDKAVRGLKRRGVHDVEEIAGDIASLAKKLFLRGLSK